MADIAAVVPTWNRRELLAGLLASLQSQTTPPKRVIVVDNGSSDGAGELARAQGATVLRFESNVGFAAAVNRGVREADTPLVAVLNNDVRLAPTWMEKLTAGIDAGAWFAAGKVLNEKQPGLIDGAFDLLSRGGCALRAGNGCPDSPEWNLARPIDIAPFTAVLLRRELFELAGYLDERFESYLEDVEFGLRCARKRYSGIYLPEAVAWHLGSATLGTWHPDTIRRIARNQVFLVARHFSNGWGLRDRWKALVAQMLWGMVAARHDCGIAFIRGKWEGLKRWEELRVKAPEQDRGVLGPVLDRHEAEIRELVKNQYLGSFWKLYFALT